MENPGEMLRRAREGGKRILKKQDHQFPVQEALPMPPPVSRHGSYTALMRSHDRVHTRHVPDRA